MSDAIREAFESSYRDTHGIDIPELAFSKDKEGGYHDPDIEYEWLVWESGYLAALQSQTAPAVPDGWLRELIEEWRTYEHNNANAADNHKGRGEAGDSKTSWNRAIVFAQCASALESMLDAAQPRNEVQAEALEKFGHGLINQYELIADGVEKRHFTQAGQWALQDAARLRASQQEGGGSDDDSKRMERMVQAWPPRDPDR